MNNTFLRYVHRWRAIGASAILLFGLGIGCATAQRNPFTPATPKQTSQPDLSPEEERAQAHTATVESFDKLKAAFEAKKKADCEGTPQDKRVADYAYLQAHVDFGRKVAREVYRSAKVQKARDNFMEKVDNANAANKNSTIQAEYKQQASKEKEVAKVELEKVEKEEKERILRQYESEFKETGCPRTYRYFDSKTPDQSSLGGGYLGGELAKNSGLVRSTESLAATDEVTNHFTDRGDPLGVGLVGGYNFRGLNNGFVIGPFASFDYLNQTINHNFAGGQFLGTTTHWFINAGVKAGVVTAPGIYLYGLGAAAWLNHDLNVNFATAAGSNVTTPGVTAGFGAEYEVRPWRMMGMPISVFAQYQHTWWDNATFNRPASSPLFNYAFRREDDTLKLGVNFYFNPPPPAPGAVPAYPVKAPALK